MLPNCVLELDRVRCHAGDCKPTWSSVLSCYGNNKVKRLPFTPGTPTTRIANEADQLLAGLDGFPHRFFPGFRSSRRERRGFGPSKGEDVESALLQGQPACRLVTLLAAIHHRLANRNWH